MSEYKVPLTKVLSVQKHPNADKLDICTVYGFNVVAQKDKYKVGDQVIFIPPDSVISEKLEKILFPEGSKIVLHNRRIRQIRIRQFPSTGMLVDPNDVSSIANPQYFELEQDLSSVLGVEKYEPVEPGPSQTIGKARERNRKHEHPLFHKYNGLSNIKWFPDLFQEGEQVVIQEKLHGTNARASKLPYVANTLWKKVRKLLRLAPKNERLYGSNNVDITNASEYKGFYGSDIYGQTFKDIGVFDRILPGEIVYGEIIGPGIQKGYEYSLKEHHFVLFDVKVLQPDGKFKWLTPDEVEQYAQARGFEFVPVLYKGPYNKELTYQLTKGPSKYDNKQKVREGVVIKAAENYDVEGNKKALKWISEAYLDGDNTDFH